MADGKETVLFGAVHGVVINVGAVKTEVTCLVVRDFAFLIFMYRPYVKEMTASHDVKKDVATFRNDDRVTKRPLVTAGT